MVCCRLSAVGCRCSNVCTCTGTCITCLMLKKSRKKLKKRQKCRQTQITLFINQQMLLQTVRREVTHFFQFFSLQNTRSEKCRWNIFSGLFLYSGIFLNFFFRIFFQGIFLWYFSFHMPNIFHERFFRLRRAFHTTAVELFLNFIECAIEFLLTSKVCLLWIRRKTQTYIQIGQWVRFFHLMWYFLTKEKKNSMIYSNCTDVSIENLYYVDFSLINAENHKRTSILFAW